MKALIWIGSRPGGIACWRTKADATKAGAVSPKQIEFPFEKVWCDCFDGILFKDGRRAPTHEAFLHCAGHVIGLRDVGTVDYLWPVKPELVTAWRQSFAP